ncbi:hypothetical protein [Alkalihalobacterium elongatum]|uniref:hypothetical protein n=1 Tax=Alkalihalobacterium elongatum TaxID=2675466 RepID=UPI001C1F8C42|nr:hypothetical protein [Alkalihalobacterium elongatum]
MPLSKKRLCYLVSVFPFVGLVFFAFWISDPDKEKRRIAFTSLLISFMSFIIIFIVLGIVSVYTPGTEPQNYSYIL